MRTTYTATFIGNDHLLLKTIETDEYMMKRNETERIVSAAETLVHDACRKAGIEEHVATTDISFRDSASHYISVMFETDADYSDIQDTLEGIRTEYRVPILELVTLVHLDHCDSEIRQDAVESFIREAINDACLDENEEDEATDPAMMYGLVGWFMDDIRKLIRDRLHDAIDDCRRN